MHILVTGGTGFIGRFLVRYLLAEGHTLTLLSRSANQSANQHGSGLQGIEYKAWDGKTLSTWADEIHRADAVINLAGEGIFDGRWTDDIKQRLMQSRVQATSVLVEAMKRSAEQHGKAPSVFVSASAVGYYGDRADALTPESAPHSSNYLAEICIRWEQEALKAAQIQTAQPVRVAMPRIGIVLHPSGGALQKMIVPFQLFVGMPLGTGKQWFPWIHISDLVRGIAEPLTNSRLQGAYNLASPNPVTMTAFCDALGGALQRPSWSWLSVPEFALNVALGEAATSLTGGQQIVPQALLDAGFVFRHPELRATLKDLLNNPK
jgi:uncharacterized protein